MSDDLITIGRPYVVLREPVASNNAIDLTKLDSTGGSHANAGTFSRSLDGVFSPSKMGVNIIELLPWVESSVPNCATAFEVGGYRYPYGPYQRIALVCGVAGTYVTSARPGHALDGEIQPTVNSSMFLDTLTITDYRNVCNSNDAGGSNAAASISIDVEGFSLIAVRALSSTTKRLGIAITGW